MLRNKFLNTTACLVSCWCQVQRNITRLLEHEEEQHCMPMLCLKLKDSQHKYTLEIDLVSLGVPRLLATTLKAQSAFLHVVHDCALDLKFRREAKLIWSNSKPLLQTRQTQKAETLSGHLVLEGKGEGTVRQLVCNLNISTCAPISAAQWSEKHGPRDQ
eukprot:5856555-Amphidinium_carterae.2